jgi:hypothetical protein
VASGIATIAGEISVTTLDIGGTNVTSTAAELNILDGVTSTAAELNILDGVTSTAAELNILDGVTSIAAEINLIDGGTARGTTAVASGDGILINDAGTMAMTNVDTVSTYFASHNVGGGNIVTTGTVASGTWAATDVAVAHGGTGSSTASAARTALGVAIGSDVQAHDADTAKLDVTQTFTKAQIPSTSTATISTSVTLDFDTYQNFVLTLGSGANTLSNPTTEASNVGQTGTIIFIQPSSSSAGTVSLASDYESIGGSGITLSSTNSQYDVVPYIIKATNSVLIGSPQLNFA